MAGGAVFFYRECCFAVVTGAARFSCFHLLHADLDLALGYTENGRMAFSAFVETGMRLVAEFDLAGILDNKGNILDRMAFAAGGQREGIFAGLLVAVTGTAGFSSFHLLHGYPDGAPGGLEYFRMTIPAVVGLCVDLVAERDIAGIFCGKSKFPGGVTFAAG